VIDGGSKLLRHRRRPSLPARKNAEGFTPCSVYVLQQVRSNVDFFLFAPKPAIDVWKVVRPVGKPYTISTMAYFIQNKGIIVFSKPHSALTEKKPDRGSADLKCALRRAF
jgi:hypothetical protein